MSAREWGLASSMLHVFLIGLTLKLCISVVISSINDALNRPNSPTVAPISILPLPQLDYRIKVDSAEWHVGMARRLLFTTCYVIATVHLNIRNIVSNKNER